MITPAQTAAMLDASMKWLTDEQPDTKIPKTLTDHLSAWEGILQQASNTQTLAKQLGLLKKQLSSDKPDASKVVALLNTLADEVLLLSSDVGAEGDTVTRLQALAAALKEIAGGVSA